MQTGGQPHSLAQAENEMVRTQEYPKSGKRNTGELRKGYQSVSARITLHIHQVCPTRTTTTVHGRTRLARNEMGLRSRPRLFCVGKQRCNEATASAGLRAAPMQTTPRVRSKMGNRQTRNRKGRVSRGRATNHEIAECTLRARDVGEGVEVS